MKTPTVDAYPARLRVLLRANPDGMTTGEMYAALGGLQKSIAAALLRMPDAYVDRWQSPVRPVWCVVVPPENCPRPRK
jgi:hypothetical protein